MVRVHADRLGADKGRAEDLTMMAHELASNAVRHGGGRGRLRLWRAGLALLCEVSDRGPGLDDDRAGRERPAHSAPGGRGLWIVRQLADRVDVQTGPTGTIVTIVLTVSGA
jgi:anti-sigma regulatory factor (Ser/Thr protein kinase)